MAKKFDPIEREKLIEEVSEYFITNKSSTRKTASHFGIGNSTVYNYVTEELAGKDIVRYLTATQILHDNLAVTKYGKEKEKRLYDIYNCLINDMKIDEICKELGISSGTFYKDIPRLDKEKLIEVKKILLRHSMENSPFIK